MRRRRPASGVRHDKRRAVYCVRAAGDAMALFDDGPWDNNPRLTAQDAVTTGYRVVATFNYGRGGEDQLRLVEGAAIYETRSSKEALPCRWKYGCVQHEEQMDADFVPPRCVAGASA
jgi:hypothetical protein